MKQNKSTFEGKEIVETEHNDGRKDVTIKVNMLNVKESDPATLKAKKHIEDVIIPELANQKVLVVVIHKPTNEHAERIVKATQVRAYATAVFDSFNKRLCEKHKMEGLEAPSTEFVIVEHNMTNNTVTVSSL